jgi:hypothetical protein
MSLAFALTATINGSQAPAPHCPSASIGPSLAGVSPAAARFSLLRGDGASRHRHCAVNRRAGDAGVAMLFAQRWPARRPGGAVAQICTQWPI